MGNSPNKNFLNDIPNYKLYIHWRVWNQHTHGLFDYDNDKEVFDTENIVNSYFEVKKNCFLMARNERVFEFNPDSISERDQVELLMSIAFKNGRYWIYHNRDFTNQDALINPSEQVWIVLKNMNKNIFKEKVKKKYGYRLRGGDTIKFGRVRFIVKKISSDSHYNPTPTLIMQEEDEDDDEKRPLDRKFHYSL